MIMFSNVNAAVASSRSVNTRSVQQRPHRLQDYERLGDHIAFALVLGSIQDKSKRDPSTRAAMGYSITVFRTSPSISSSERGLENTHGCKESLHA